jgi:hypothetical protein
MPSKPRSAPARQDDHRQLGRAEADEDRSERVRAEPHTTTGKLLAWPPVRAGAHWSPNAISSFAHSLRLGKSTIGPDAFAQPLILPVSNLLAGTLTYPLDCEHGSPGSRRNSLAL